MPSPLLVTTCAVELWLFLTAYAVGSTVERAQAQVSMTEHQHRLTSCMLVFVSSGAEVISVVNDDENKTFGVVFRTPVSESVGLRKHTRTHTHANKWLRFLQERCVVGQG
eukprot:1138534-Pelagomonas_calceolata.AAC.5